MEADLIRMTIKATLDQIFGSGASQTADRLLIPIPTGVSAERILALMVARLSSYEQMILIDESIDFLLDESGKLITTSLKFSQLEFERLPTQFATGTRADRFFIGLDKPL